jgi:hypothetical protein
MPLSPISATWELAVREISNDAATKLQCPVCSEIFARSGSHSDLQTPLLSVNRQPLSIEGPYCVFCFETMDGILRSSRIDEATVALCRIMRPVLTTERAAKKEIEEAKEQSGKEPCQLKEARWRSGGARSVIPPESKRLSLSMSKDQHAEAKEDSK